MGATRGAGGQIDHESNALGGRSNRPWRAHETDARINHGMARGVSAQINYESDAAGRTGRAGRHAISATEAAHEEPKRPSPLNKDARR